MNSNSLLKKFFIGQMVVLNIIVLILIIIELINFSKIVANTTEIERSEQAVGEITKLPNLDLVNVKYYNLINTISKDNSLANLLEFVEANATKYQIQILNTRVIEASNEEIRYQLELTGNMKNLADFIRSIEENSMMMEVIETEILYKNNTPYMKITIKVTKI